jgi:DNA-binding FrmR family transcriptional regulator
MATDPVLDTHLQDDILARLKRIEGQIRGLQAMVTQGKDCEGILTQVRAAQSALKAVSGLILKGYLLKCYGELGKEPDLEAVFQNLHRTVAMLTKFISG